MRGENPDPASFFTGSGSCSGSIFKSSNISTQKEKNSDPDPKINLPDTNTFHDQFEYNGITFFQGCIFFVFLHFARG